MNKTIQDNLKAINVAVTELNLQIQNEIFSQLPDESDEKMRITAFFTTSAGIVFKEFLLEAALRGSALGPNSDAKHCLLFDTEEDAAMVDSLLEKIGEISKDKPYDFDHEVVGCTIYIMI